MIKVCDAFVYTFILFLWRIYREKKNVISLFNLLAENYRLQSKYENHLIAKVALFQFVNSFLSLFYIAFYLRDQDKLKEQLAGKK